MMRFKLIIFLSILNILILTINAKNEEYIGYKVYNVKLNSTEQEDNFYRIKNDFIDYWRKPSFKYNTIGHAMVPPAQATCFEERLDELGLAKDIYIDDVYKYLLAREETSMDISRSDNTFSFNDYYRYSQILDYIRTLEATYENSTNINLSVIEAGTTAEGRPLVYIKLTNQTPMMNKRIIIIEAGINPRQWITIPSSLNIIHRLKDSNNTRLLNDFEWIFIPVLNPDGYEYTHTNLRLWTKSRSASSNLGAICPGVNINRNFNIDWLNSDSSSSPCSHLYGGIESFSEVESRLIQSLLEEYGNRTSAYISLQNNGGFISYPWQYERAASGLFAQHHILGMKMIEAMVDNYELDIASVAYGDRASGTSTDYMRYNGVLYTFNIDVVPRGQEGVVVPREEIQIIADDVWRAVSVLAENLL
ncbi:PREDICTED: carboxypeptidase B-like [Papilio xuthus]|uniref:Carboxypeptidase B-like n=1 Tax=Papilio xuthus TaxID=66420 RepID=A0AAJ6ZFJ4_PAPXU|nr:PREDICTED: carboxypeptidase B-like [Papilio xuthus]